MTRIVDLEDSTLSELYPTRLPVFWGRKGTAGPHPTDHESVTGRQVVIGIVKKFNRLERLLARLFRAPKMLRRPLDEINSLLWEMMDGKTTFSTICYQLDSTFHEQISPVVDRCAMAIEQFKRLGLAVMLEKKIDDLESINAGILPEGLEAPDWQLDY